MRAVAAARGGTDYERDNIVAALGKGYAVLVTDYAGYTTGSTPTYTVGTTEGNAVLDIVRAASQVPNSRHRAIGTVGLWGYSQGGQAAAWAGQLQPTYAPSVPLKGVVAGGVPADLRKTAAYLDGGTGAAFVFESIIGLATEYPNLPIDAVLNDAGKAAFAKLKTQCVFEALLEQQNKKVSDYTVGGLTLDQLLGIPFVATAVDAQKLGAHQGERAACTPSTAGPTRSCRSDQAYQLKRDWCARGHQHDVGPVPERAHHDAVPERAEVPAVPRRPVRRHGGDGQLRAGDATDVHRPAQGRRLRGDAGQVEPGRRAQPHHARQQGDPPGRSGPSRRRPT